MSKALAAMIKQRSQMIADPDIIGSAPKAPEAVAPTTPHTPVVHTYEPKTTTFSGANKCCICEKTVYKMEETIAVGKVWHNACFTCGGSSDEGCKKTLKRDSYVDHDSQPFCNACYNKNFRTKGFGVGTSLNTDYGASSPHTPASSTPHTPAPENSTSTPVTPSAPVVKPAFVVTPATPPSGVKPAASSAVKHTPSAVASSTPKCTACAKSVYKMEEMIAVGRVWHALCFTCGGTSKTDPGCGKTLKRDGYVDHDNQPYCNACYSKQFRPKGFGYGGALNTDYGPNHAEPVVSEVTAAVEQLHVEASKPPAPPAPPAPPVHVAAVVAPPAPPAAPAAVVETPKPPAPVVAPTPPPVVKAAAPPAPIPVEAPIATPAAPVSVASVSASAVTSSSSNESNAKFKQAAILKSQVPNRQASISIGASTSALKDDNLHKESGYVGDNDEVDESEW